VVASHTEANPEDWTTGSWTTTCRAPPTRLYWPPGGHWYA